MSRRSVRGRGSDEPLLELAEDASIEEEEEFNDTQGSDSSEPDDDGNERNDGAEEDSDDDTPVNPPNTNTNVVTGTDGKDMTDSTAVPVTQDVTKDSSTSTGVNVPPSATVVTSTVTPVPQTTTPSVPVAQVAPIAPPKPVYTSENCALLNAEFRAKASVNFCLHDACEVNDVAFLKSFFTRYPDLPNTFVNMHDINARDIDNCTPLHVSLLHGNIESAEIMLANNADVHAKCEGNTAYHLVLTLGGVYIRYAAFVQKAIDLLIKYKCDWTIADDVGRTPLHLAAIYNMVPIARRLIQACSMGDVQGYRDGRETTLDFLFHVDNDGRNALHYALQYRNLDMVVYLLDVYTQYVSSMNNLQIQAVRPEITPTLELSHYYGAGAGYFEFTVPTIRARSDVGWYPIHTAYYYAAMYYSDIDALMKDPIVQLCSAISGSNNTQQPNIHPNMKLVVGTVEDTCLMNFTCIDWAKRTLQDNTSTSTNTTTDTTDNEEIIGSSVRPSKFLISWSPHCFNHFTAKRITRLNRPPPENVRRLQVLLNYNDGILRGDHLNLEYYTNIAKQEQEQQEQEQQGTTNTTNTSISNIITDASSLPPRYVPCWYNQASPATISDVLRTHEYPYIHNLLTQISYIDQQEVTKDVVVQSVHSSGDALGSSATIPILNTTSTSTNNSVYLDTRNTTTKEYHPPALVVTTCAEDGTRQASVGDVQLLSSLLQDNALTARIYHTNSSTNTNTNTTDSMADDSTNTNTTVYTAGRVYRDNNGAIITTSEEEPTSTTTTTTTIDRNIHNQPTCSTHITTYTPSYQMLSYLDDDTALSKHSFKAALYAAGIVIDAVKKLMKPSLQLQRAFCVLRPPGHHAGPNGIVYNDERVGSSHGFCLFNNVAIAAAYAKCMYPEQIKKVCIIDFDVHHGNGTEAIVRALQPGETKAVMRNDFHDTITLLRKTYKPWYNWNDSEHVMFTSVHGYNDKETGTGPWFYPGSGATNEEVTQLVEEEVHTLDTNTYTPTLDINNITLRTLQSQPTHILNAGVGQKQRNSWRKVWLHAILPKILQFAPDMLFISAGFDAHKRDEVNLGYIGVDDEDFYWLTKQLIKVANTCAQGRIVSVLEGGYRIHGRIASPFAKSVDAHVRAMNENCTEKWDTSIANMYSEQLDWKRNAVLQMQRQRVLQQQQEQEALLKDAGEIVTGKRVRKPVDYVALNAKLKSKKIKK